MEQLNLNNILNRIQQEKQLQDILNKFEKEKHLMQTRRGIYIYMVVPDQAKHIL